MSLWEDIGRAGLGVSTGGISEIALRSNLFNDPEMVNQSLLETPDKTAARQKLSQFIQTGSFGNFTAGTPYTGQLGSYSPTDLETAGLGKLKTLLSSSYPDIMGAGSDELKKILTTDAYNPMNDQGVYNGLTGGIDRNTMIAQAGAKRAGSYMGNLYSSAAVNKQGDIAAQGGIAKSNILAQLYQNYVQQKQNAIPQALAYGQGQEAMDLGKVGASQSYGSLERILQDKNLKDQYSEFIRQRQEMTLPITAAQNMLGQDENYTIPSVPKPNPWDQILNTLIGAGSKFAGASMAA